MPVANLRRARTARNLSLSELSQPEADLSLSELSQPEADAGDR
ncbi:hypothetical protein [Actinoallomurus sp. CA-142502]